MPETNQTQTDPSVATGTADSSSAAPTSSPDVTQSDNNPVADTPQGEATPSYAPYTLEQAIDVLWAHLGLSSIYVPDQVESS